MFNKIFIRILKNAHFDEGFFPKGTNILLAILFHPTGSISGGKREDRNKRQNVIQRSRDGEGNRLDLGRNYSVFY